MTHGGDFCGVLLRDGKAGAVGSFGVAGKMSTLGIDAVEARPGVEVVNFNGGEPGACASIDERADHGKDSVALFGGGGVEDVFVGPVRIGFGPAESVVQEQRVVGVRPFGCLPGWVWKPLT